MHIFWLILWACDALVFLFCMWMMWRNGRVYKMRTAMIEKIFKYHNVGWRLRVYHKVSYSDMMWSLKPVRADSFYKSTDFLNAEDEE